MRKQVREEMRKKIGATVLVLCIGITMCGCRKTPDKTIVQNKDFDKIVEQAGQGDDGTSVVEKTGDIREYKKEWKDESFRVNVKVDAKVEIPDVQKMSLISVQRETISQDFLNHAIEVLDIDETLYDGSASYILSKDDIEKKMAYCEQHRDEYELGVYEGYMNNYKIMLETAPTEINMVKDYVSDGKLHEMSYFPKNEYYESFNCNQNREMYYGATDGMSGDYITVYAQNDKNHGNYFSFRKSKHNYIDIDSPFTTSVYGDFNPEKIWKIGNEEQLAQYNQSNDIRNIYYKDEICTISEDDARKMEDEIVKKLGLTDMEFYRGAYFGEKPSMRREENALGSQYYIMDYMKKVDGVFLEYVGDLIPPEEQISGINSYIRQWSDELLEIRINDNGIVGVSYYNPLSLHDVEVEQSNVKSFDEIKGVFENRVAKKCSVGWTQVDIHVSKVRLGYDILVAKGNFENALLIPAWIFTGDAIFGENKDHYEDYTFMRINAVDGTIVDDSSR